MLYKQTALTPDFAICSNTVLHRISEGYQQEVSPYPTRCTAEYEEPSDVFS